MNRASRIMNVAKTGQVWASGEAWSEARDVVNQASEGHGVAAHALNMLRVRYGKAAPPDVEAAREEVAEAARTARDVGAAVLPPQRLKGINEEVAMVALSLKSEHDDDELTLVAAKNTVEPRSFSRRHSGSSFRSGMRDAPDWGGLGDGSVRPNRAAPEVPAPLLEGDEEGEEPGSAAAGAAADGPIVQRADRGGGGGGGGAGGPAGTSRLRVVQGSAPSKTRLAVMSPVNE